MNLRPGPFPGAAGGRGAAASTMAPAHPVQQAGTCSMQEQQVSALRPRGLVLAEPCISQNRYRSLYIDFIWFY